MTKQASGPGLSQQEQTLRALPHEAHLHRALGVAGDRSGLVGRKQLLQLIPRQRLQVSTCHQRCIAVSAAYSQLSQVCIAVGEVGVWTCSTSVTALCGRSSHKVADVLIRARLTFLGEMSLDVVPDGGNAVR